MEKIRMVIPLMLLIFSTYQTMSATENFSVPFEKYSLPNGLTVVLHQDKSDPIVSVAIYYHVGSSRETPGKTGFAHLFEHMMFQESENLARGQFFTNISNAGGSLNGSTNQDRTNYFELVPKNALELVLWMESDRMGYLENTVTKTNLANQQNVVQNEKRQSYDNAPYGFNQGLILKNLYPMGHPYSWTVIGEMEDLTNATVEDVRAFHKKYYSPGNATLVISGDIAKDEVKKLVARYFGEIPAGEKVEKRSPMPVKLASTVRLYHEDNFARIPMLTMAFPTVEEYSKDSYALDFLGELLANSKKAPLHKVLVMDKKLTSRVMARNRSQELAGYFNISISANPGVNLTDIEKAIFEGFDMFEKEGFTDGDLTRIKAETETLYFSRFSSVQEKGFMLAEYEIGTGDPGYYKRDMEMTNAVTMADIKAVYNKYIKGKNFVETSFVPKGAVDLAVHGSVSAAIKEEDVTNAAEVKAEAAAFEPIVKTKTAFDRTVSPVIGADPEVTIPKSWRSSLSNGLKIWGITQKEVPLVQYSVVISGGHLLDKVEKAGMANLVAAMMNEGTKNKTPEQLEEAIGMLGANIRVSAGNEDITIDISSLSKNFEKTLKLVEEILLEPRWDEEQFSIAKTRIANGIKRNASTPDFLSAKTLNSLIFGNSILATEVQGTEKSVESITLDDLKNFYTQYFSPSISKFLISGDVDQTRVQAALAELNDKWPAKEVKVPEIPVPDAPAVSKIYFVDVPGAKQSVISIGGPSIPRTNPDFFPAVVANYKLGDRDASMAGLWMQIIREEKGFTYGAYSRFAGFKNYGYFSASSRVRTNSTLESVQIFKNEMDKYGKIMPQEYIDFTKSGLMKSNARRFETLNSLISYLNTISSYDLAPDYIKKEESYLKQLTPEKQLEIVKKYIDPSRMYYVVVGDAKTQLEPLKSLGLGEPELIK